MARRRRRARPGSPTTKGSKPPPSARSKPCGAVPPLRSSADRPRARGARDGRGAGFRRRSRNGAEGLRLWALARPRLEGCRRARTGRFCGLAWRSCIRAARRRVGCGPDRADRRLARAIIGARRRDAGRHPRRGRSSGDCQRARRRFLGLRADRCRAALAREAQRSCEDAGILWRWGLWEACCERRLVALIAAVLMLGTSPSKAHRISTRTGAPPEGVAIPSLTHGQMAVIADNLPAIRALASARSGSTSRPGGWRTT